MLAFLKKYRFNFRNKGKNNKNDINVANTSFWKISY